MKIVSKIVFFICFSIIICCKENNEVFTYNQKSFYIDIVDDSNLEMIFIEEEKGISKISLISNNKESSIMNILPLYKEEYKTNFPSIENIYLEANNIQTDKKSLRIKIRNTDLLPDYYYLDICFSKNEWIINNIGVINSKDSVYIKDKAISYKLNKVVDSNGAINIRRLIMDEGLILEYENFN